MLDKCLKHRELRECPFLLPECGILCARMACIGVWNGAFGLPVRLWYWSRVPMAFILVKHINVTLALWSMLRLRHSQVLLGVSDRKCCRSPCLHSRPLRGGLVRNQALLVADVLYFGIFIYIKNTKPSLTYAFFVVILWTELQHYYILNLHHYDRRVPTRWLGWETTCAIGRSRSVQVCGN